MSDLADLRLHVRIDEGEGPVIVLLHGINSTADDLRPLIDELGPHYRVIAPDLLGFGESPKPVGLDYSTDQQVQVLHATLEELGFAERFLLFGYSLGGVIAVRYAASHPGRLRRLFLLSTPFYLPPEAYSRRGFGVEYAQAMLFTWLWKVVGRQKEHDTAAYGLAAGPLRSAAEDFLRATDLSEHWDVMARTLENAISQSTMVDDLPRLTVPTVFALGVRDPIVRPDQTLALQRMKPDLEVRRILGLTADHLLIKSTPERVAAEVLRDEAATLNIGLRTGAGTPLVLLPDLQETWQVWRATADELAVDHDVVAVDLLGAGESPTPLTSAYTLEDHAGAVLATARDEFGDRPFQVAGRRFGAAVALACASADPQAVSRVVAISPLLPDTTHGPGGPALAELEAARDSLLAIARDERVQRITNERVERQLVPAVRSMSGLLDTSMPRLVNQLTTPVRFLLPGPSTEVPGWLAARAEADPAAVSIDSTPGIANPERSPELVAAAVRGRPLPPVTVNPDPVLPRRGSEPISDALGRLNTRLLVRGGLEALLGLLLLLWPGGLPVELVTVALAGWIGVQGVQTLGGALGLRQRGRPWLAWAGLGVLGIGFALALVAGALFAARLVVWIIVVGAALRGLALLAVAAKAGQTPGRRWVLVLDGVLSLAIAIAVLSWPPLGARLLRFSVGGYLAASGLGRVGYAHRNHTAARARLRQYLTQAG